ncbi:lysylphosphatidylglycerol synthase transmembrane domain-containing protein [Persephonella sp.]
MKKKYLKYFELAVSIAVTAGFIYLFYAVIGFDKFVSFFTQIQPVNIVIAFILYTLSYVTRAFRWKLTLSIDQFGKLFRITAFNTVFNIFLPFRTGELSFFYMLKKENIPVSESAISFISVRIFDAVSLFAVFGMAYFIFKGSLIAGIAVILAAPLIPVILKAVTGFIKHQKLSQFRNTKLTLRNIGILYFLSVLTFILKFTAFYLVLPSGLDFPFSQAFFAAAAGDITTILPIHGIAGIGTYEGGYAGALILIGVDKEKALLASVFAHIFMLAGAAIIAGFSYLFIGKDPRKGS